MMKQDDFRVYLELPQMWSVTLNGTVYRLF